jgi:hypothetical protein
VLIIVDIEVPPRSWPEPSTTAADDRPRPVDSQRGSLTGQRSVGEADDALGALDGCGVADHEVDFIVVDS